MQQPAEKLPPHSYYKLMCFPLYNRVSLLQALSSIRLFSTLDKNATYVQSGRHFWHPNYHQQPSPTLHHNTPTQLTRCC